MYPKKEVHQQSEAGALIDMIQRTRKEIEGLEQVLNIKKARLELAEKAFARVVTVIKTNGKKEKKSSST